MATSQPHNPHEADQPTDASPQSAETQGQPAESSPSDAETLRQDPTESSLAESALAESALAEGKLEVGGKQAGSTEAGSTGAGVFRQLPERVSLAVLEVSNLSPTLIAADCAAKAAGVFILAIESTDGSAQCIKLVGAPAAVQEAAEQAERRAQQMGAETSLKIMPAPRPEVLELAGQPPIYNPLLQIYDSRIPRNRAMESSDAIGLLETQGLVAALHATDTMLKSASVKLLGKEKIGAAYVTIMIRGDVAAVQAAIEAGRSTVTQLGGKLIMADVITRPHPELAALLPA